MSEFIDDEMVEAAGAALLHCPLSDAAFKQILEAALPLIGAKLMKEGDTLKRAMPVDDITTRVNEPTRATECDTYDEGIEDFAARIRELTGARS